MRASSWSDSPERDKSPVWGNFPKRKINCGARRSGSEAGSGRSLVRVGAPPGGGRGGRGRCLEDAGFEVTEFVSDIFGVSVGAVLQAMSLTTRLTLLFSAGAGRRRTGLGRRGRDAEREKPPPVVVSRLMSGCNRRAILARTEPNL